MRDVDTVVIGSGAGGLTAALCLAQAGEKVVVFEQHYLPGGWCHSFNLGGYRFSPGVHYIGELQPGGAMRRIWDGLGVTGDMSFLELNPDGYDHVLLPAGGGAAARRGGGEGSEPPFSMEQFDIPAGRERFAQRLVDRFPAEKKGIHAYLETCSRIAHELNEMMEVKSLGDAVKLAFRSPTLARWVLRSARALIGKYARDPRLRAILAAQSGDHGLPPSMAPAVLHASVAAHYFNGGWYPRGGGYSIPRALIRGLRRHGGEIHVRTAVERILVERGRAIGVRLADGTEVRARRVISNADPGVTFGRLVEPEHLSSRLRRKLARTRWSVSALSLFLATDLDVRALGLDSGNYWLYDTLDVDGVYRAGLRADGTEAPVPPGMFVTVTTLKDPTKTRAHAHHHTIEAFTFVGWEGFRRWAETRYGQRPEDYARMKSDLMSRMIRGVSRVVPGLADRVVFAELGTPLTNVHYVAATRGNLYGTEKTLGQIGPWSFAVRTEIPGLTLCGASTVGHGVMGATVSGLVAAREALGCRVSDLLSRRAAPPSAPDSEVALSA